MLDNLCLCSVWPIPPKPYGNSQGSIEGNNEGFHILTLVFLHVQSQVFFLTGQMSECYSLMVFIVFVENSSPVMPWTINGQDLLLCHPPLPYHVHWLTLDFYLNLMDDSQQPLEDLPQDMKPILF